VEYKDNSCQITGSLKLYSDYFSPVHACTHAHTHVCAHTHTYRVSGNVMLVLQCLISEIISNQKCYVNICPILNSYVAMDILNSG
jgi:hypothetical protein